MLPKNDLDNAYIKREYESGKSAYQIADQLGVHPTTIYRRLQKSNTPIRSQTLDLDIREIKKLYATGLSCLKTGNALGISESAVIKRLEKAGVRRRANKIDVDIEKVRELYLGEKSIYDIAALLGCSIEPIIKALKEIGVERRNRSDCQIPAIGLRAAKETYRNKEWLYKQYCLENKTQCQIAETCGTKRYIISWWMRKYNISARTRKEQALLLVKRCGLTTVAKLFIDGLLLGDGSITNFSSIAASYAHTDKHKEYLVWLSNIFSTFGIAQCGNINYRVAYSKGYKCPAFRFGTLMYADLLDIRNRWYKNGKRHVPQDIALEPITCMNWYIGDGGLNPSQRGRPDIQLSTCCFAKKDVLRLIGKLEKLGISANYRPSSNSIGIGTKDTPKFLDYIGPCPKEIWPCYGYKWDLTRSKKQWEAEFAHA